MFPESHTRRRFLGLSGVAALGLVVAACGGSSGTAAVTEVPVDNGEDALARLLEGNDRFVADKTRPVNVGKDRRAKLVKRERPFALVFSCVDSRVPAELVFDRGLGDLYVVSTAAEVLDQAVLATIEYGVTDLEIPLVVVLGHSGCSFVSGAVATLASGEGPSPEMAYLVEALTPAVNRAKDKLKPTVKPSTKKNTTTTTAPAASAKPPGTTTTTIPSTPDPNTALVAASVEAQVEVVIERLKVLPVVADRLKKDRLLVVGAVYDLESGRVDVTVNMPAGVKKTRDDLAAKTAKTSTGASTTASATTTIKK